jgi:hypothetical protein
MRIDEERKYTYSIINTTASVERDYETTELSKDK